MSERLRILVVGEKPTDIDDISKALREVGSGEFDLESVTRLSDAVSRLERRDVDLVLLDLALPDSRGLPTLRRLRTVVTATTRSEEPITGERFLVGAIHDVTERERAHLERQAMQEIAQSVATTANLDELLAAMHQALRRVIQAENCFVALHDARTGLFSFPYFVDEYDTVPEPLAMPASCTAYVFRHGLPTLITPSTFRDLQAQGEVERVGTPSASWMGVPLRTPSGVIGILVVQEYEREDAYNAHDLEFLASVAGQVALLIERRLGVAALRDREAELNVILESTADGLLAVDSTGKVLRTNRRFAEMWRIPGDIIASREDARLLQHVLSQLVDPDAFLAKVQAVYASTDETADHLNFLDGRVFNRHSVPIIKDGALAGRVWSFHDITERVRTEEAKAALEVQLHHAEKLESIGRLAGGVAHDFNNMLAVILGYTELALQRVEPTQPLHADLLEIQRAARHSAEVTAQLLAYARRQTVQPVELDLNEQVLGLLSMLQRLIGESIRIDWQPGVGLWPVRIDPSQLASALTNLCLNARDAIANVGTIFLSTTNDVLDARFCAAHPEAAPGDYVRLSVRDSGRGIDEATLARIFEPFFTTKGVGEGTGLGLASVYGVVKQNGGFIYATSEPGQGAAFDIYLPRQGGAIKTPRWPGPVAAAGHGQETILLVEDEVAILRLTKRVLEAQGYVVLAAGSPSEAIRIAREHDGDIHLLLSDVAMPEMSGRDMAASLQSLRPSVKQLFTSGHAADVITTRGMLEPGVSFIEKPYSIAALHAKVREVLDTE